MSLDGSLKTAYQHKLQIMKYLLIALVFLPHLSLQSQTLKTPKETEADPVVAPQWKQKNNASVDLNEVAFVNWNSGGSNSISALFGVKSSLDYTDKYFSWKNRLEANYGVNKQEDKGVRKTADFLKVESNAGFKPDIQSNWFYSARLKFRTQLVNGYKYPDTDTPISRFMAPGYLFFGGGMEYGKNLERISLYFSPLTLKATFVLDEALANSGAFGVKKAVYDAAGKLLEKGEQLRREVGILITNSYKTEVIENIEMKNEISLYTDYINNFGNIDLDWQLNFDFKVNNYVRATLGSHIRYDDDIKTKEPSEKDPKKLEERGPKIQWKQFLGVGFAIDF